VWPLSVSFDTHRKKVMLRMVLRVWPECNFFDYPVIIKKITQATLLEPFLALPFSCGYQNLHSEATLLEPFLASPLSCDNQKNYSPGKMLMIRMV
jgi:hypothetical protein